MKTVLTWAAGLTGAALVAGTAAAQNLNLQWGNPQQNQPSYNEGNGAFNGPFCDAKHLIDQQLVSHHGYQLGQIRDIVFNRQNGEILAAIDIDNGRTALVPFQTLNVGGTWNNMQVTLNVSREELENGPTVPRDRWLEALNHHPRLAERVYSHYNIPSPNGMGGSY